MNNILLFSQRKKLAESYDRWRDGTNIEDCALNVISYLETKGLINVKKAKEQIKNDKQ